MPIGDLLLAAFIALALWLLAVAFLGITMPRPDVVPARPAHTREDALAQLAELQAADDSHIAGPCATRLLEPDGAPTATIVLWHGFTNCPAQFAEVAEALRARGYRVLLPRIPRHGVADVLTRELTELRPDDLTAHAAAVIDIAAGFGDPVWVAGLSAGGVLAAWVAATRAEVQRVVVSAPFVAPKAMPMPVVRLMVRLRRLVPAIYLWWDPRKKENLGESPYVYPGFPLPGMLPFLHVAEALYDRRVPVTTQPSRVVLTSNPGDFAIRRDVALEFVNRVFGGRAQTVAVATLDDSLGWWHDFVDPHGPHHGTTEQVTEVFLSAFGVAEDPSALGCLVEPLPPLSPANLPRSIA